MNNVSKVFENESLISLSLTSDSKDLTSGVKWN
jgi:hypothetical protein